MNKTIKTYCDECPICIESFKDLESLTVYECRHLIHTTCLKFYQNVKGSKLKIECPTCKVPVKNFKKLSKIINKIENEEEKKPSNKS